MTHDANESYSRLVLFRLDTLADDVKALDSKVDVLMIDVAMLKVKSGLWGAVAGMIPASVAIVLSVVLG